MPVRLISAVRLASAAVFVLFGAGKFVNHASELASFRSYELPLPGVLVVLVGVLELGGGLLLVARRATVAVALALAAGMVVAIVVSGIARGEPVSLTLAPALLLAMVLVVVDERGRRRG